MAKVVKCECDCETTTKSNLPLVLTLVALLCAVGAGLICLLRYTSTKKYYESWSEYDNYGVH